MSTDLTFEISEITSNGEVIITFSDNIIVPANWKQMNEEDIEV